MEHNKLTAIISLLDDPDELVYNQVKEQLIHAGPSVIDELEHAWEQSKDVVQQGRIENIIHAIQFNKTLGNLKEWVASGGIKLMDGALIIARYQFPDLNTEKVTAHIEQLKQDVWLELTPHLTAMENVRVINHILFEVHGFSGNNEEFHNPYNSMINMVLQSKKGNPLSLSIIYATIAQSLGIPIFGVNLPQHFILAYMGSQSPSTFFDLKNKEVLFYINAFSRGTIFSRKEVEVYLKQLNLQAQESFFYPCSNIEMIRRMLNNLIFAYEKNAQTAKVEDLKKLMQCIA